MSYVYQYIDCITNLPFYIGKGTDLRDGVHLLEAKKILQGRALKGRPSFCVIKIVKMLRENLPFKIERIQEDLSHEEAYALETTLVSKYGRRGIDEGGILTNRAIGGRGGKGFKMSAEAIQKLIERNKASKGKAKPGLSLFYKKNPDRHPSKSLIGTKYSDIRKKNMSAGQIKSKCGLKILTFKSPSGDITRTENWRQFLIDHCLSYNLIRGKGKIYTKGPNAGWSLVGDEYLKPRINA